MLINDLDDHHTQNEFIQKLIKIKCIQERVKCEHSSSTDDKKLKYTTGRFFSTIQGISYEITLTNPRSRFTSHEGHNLWF